MNTRECIKYVSEKSSYDQTLFLAVWENRPPPCDGENYACVSMNHWYWKIASSKKHSPYRGLDENPTEYEWDVECRTGYQFQDEAANAAVEWVKKHITEPRKLRLRIQDLEDRHKEYENSYEVMAEYIDQWDNLVAIIEITGFIRELHQKIKN